MGRRQGGRKLRRRQGRTTIRCENATLSAAGNVFRLRRVSADRRIASFGLPRAKPQASDPDRLEFQVRRERRYNRRSQQKEPAMLRALVAAAVVIFLTATARAADDKPGAELNGRWRLQTTNGEKDKHADSADESSLLTFNIEDGTWKLEPRSDDGGFTFYGSFTVDPTQTPKVLDAVIQGDGGNTDVFAIYEVSGDVLKLNLRKDGQRAADFELMPEVSTLMTFKKHTQPQ
jgi:uncharacterized protein (TIGR03067 family)